MPKFYNHVNLKQNELQNAVIQHNTGNPSNAVEGQIYYDDGDDTMYYYDGSNSWISMKNLDTTLDIFTNGGLQLGSVDTDALAIDWTNLATTNYTATSDMADTDLFAVLPNVNIADADNDAGHRKVTLGLVKTYIRDGLPAQDTVDMGDGFLIRDTSGDDKTITESKYFEIAGDTTAGVNHITSDFGSGTGTTGSPFDLKLTLNAANAADGYILSYTAAGGLDWIANSTTNATHTGQVTGSSALTAQPLLITDQTDMADDTLVGGDSILVHETSGDTLNEVTMTQVKAFTSPDASATVAGLVELATDNEANAGTATGGDAELVVTPANLQAFTGSTAIATLGTISAGTWQGTKIASAYLDDDTMHLSGAQTVTGVKTLSTTTKLQFYDTGMFMHASGDGALQITSDTTLGLTAPDIDLSGSSSIDLTTPLVNQSAVSSNFKMTSTGSNPNNSSIISLVKDAVDTEAGETLGVIKFMGDDGDAPSLVSYAAITGTTESVLDTKESGKLAMSILTPSGGSGSLRDALVLTGSGAASSSDTVDATIGYGASSTTTTAGHLQVTGDLTVQGTTTTVESTTVTIEDPIFTLGGTTAVVDDNKDRGVEFTYGGVSQATPGVVFVSNVCTITNAGHGFPVGSMVTVAGSGINNFDGTYTITSTPDDDTYTITTAGIGNQSATIAGTVIVSRKGFFGLDDSATKFTALKDASNATEIFTGTPMDVSFGAGTFTGAVTSNGTTLTGTEAAYATITDDSTGTTTAAAAGGSLQIKGDGTFTTTAVTSDVVTITGTHRAIHDSPSDSATTTSISSNWAYDHNAGTGNDAHVPSQGTNGHYLAHNGAFAQVAYNQISNTPDLSSYITSLDGNSATYLIDVDLDGADDGADPDFTGTATINHSFSSSNLIVQVYEQHTGSQRQQIFPDINIESNSKVVVTFNTLPTVDCHVHIINLGTNSTNDGTITLT
tara:strand:+ start:1894 stop:4761 length:2868 start_codon:yes stop_codon:yes gene_type:complete